MTQNAVNGEHARKPSRRRLLSMLGAGSAAGAAGWALFSSSRVNAYYQGPASDHFDGTVFFNPGGVAPRGRLAFIKWQLWDRGVDWPASFPSPFAPDRPPARYDRPGARISHAGHASLLLQTRGQNVLIDPVWADRASPVSFAGPKRVNAPGIAFDDLPRIDLVLVSHNHYDHMDTGTIGRLWQRFRPAIITPLGNDAILKSAVPDIEVQPVDWDERIALAGGLAVHVEPTLHWSARGTRDRRHALWASFVLEAGARKIYCVSDTGFGDGATFRRVRQRHPELAVALLPIGAYEPRWMMKNSHMNPGEAVEALSLCGAPRALGHHWGTFRLTNEAVEQPAQDLAAALARRRLPPDRFTALRPGQVVVLD